MINGYKKICVVCGKEFTTLGFNGTSNAKYCGEECRKKVNRVRVAKYKKRLREENKKAKKTILPDTPKHHSRLKVLGGKSISELTHEALAAGTSYGKYVGQLYIKAGLV